MISSGIITERLLRFQITFFQTSKVVTMRDPPVFPKVDLIPFINSLRESSFRNLPAHMDILPDSRAVRFPIQTMRTIFICENPGLNGIGVFVKSPS